MPIQLRILLIVGAVGTMVYFIGEIRKNQLQIKHALFWTIASLVLVLMSLLPTKVYEVIRYVGLQSPTNFVFLILIFALIIRQFSDTVKISVLERKLAILTQRIALMKLDEEKQTEAVKKTLETQRAAAEKNLKETTGGKEQQTEKPVEAALEEPERVSTGELKEPEGNIQEEPKEPETEPAGNMQGEPEKPETEPEGNIQEEPKESGKNAAG